MDKTKEIIAELKISYAIELETIQNYLANSIDLDDTDAEAIRKLLDKEITLKLKRARRLAKRIHVLGGRIPGSLELQANQNFLQPPLDKGNITAVIRGVINASEIAITQYERIISLADGLDHVSQDMVIDLLSDERELRRVFLNYLAWKSHEPRPS